MGRSLMNQALPMLLPLSNLQTQPLTTAKLLLRGPYCMRLDVLVQPAVVQREIKRWMPEMDPEMDCRPHR